MQNWFIAGLCAALGLWISVSDCSGWPFDSARDEAEAQAYLETRQTDNRIRIDRARADLVREQAVLVTQGLIVPQHRKTPWYVWLCGTTITISIIVAVLIIVLSRRHKYRPAPAMPEYHPRTPIELNGREYRLELVRERRIERGAP